MLAVSFLWSKKNPRFLSVKCRLNCNVKFCGKLVEDEFFENQLALMQSSIHIYISSINLENSDDIVKEKSIVRMSYRKKTFLACHTGKNLQKKKKKQANKKRQTKKWKKRNDHTEEKTLRVVYVTKCYLCFVCIKYLPRIFARSFEIDESN